MINIGDYRTKGTPSCMNLSNQVLINYFLGLQPKSSKNNLNANDHMESSHASISEKALTSHLLHHKDGSTVLMQMIVYLSPGDYHRFHSPADWSVNYRRYDLTLNRKNLIYFK